MLTKEKIQKFIECFKKYRRKRHCYRMARLHRWEQFELLQLFPELHKVPKTGGKLPKYNWRELKDVLELSMPIKQLAIKYGVAPATIWGWRVKAIKEGLATPKIISKRQRPPK